MLLIIAVTDTMADRADELHGKHTLFGRVIGDTIYSAFHQLNVKEYLPAHNLRRGENRRYRYALSLITSPKT